MSCQNNKGKGLKPALNLAIFASGNGSNFEAIVKEIRLGKIKAGQTILVSDQPDALVIKRAIRHKVKIILVDRKDFRNRLDFERAIIQRLEDYSIDLIILAGFMRLLSPSFVKKYRNRIMNIHPSFLPAFKGACAIKDAFNAKCGSTGVTVHFVDEQVDHGPVILQQKVRIAKKESLPHLERKIHAVEHKLYPKAIKLFINAKNKGKGR